MMKRFRPAYEHSCVVAPAEQGFAELERSAKAFEGCGKQILLSFTGDPYCGIVPEATTRVLEILLKYNHKVAILTKGGLRSMNDIELLKMFGDNVKVGATLTFDNANDSLEWESGAALPDERIDALKSLHDAGIKTWASFEPVIIPEQSLRLMERVASFADHVKIGKLNNYKGIDKKIDWSDFISKAVKICRDNSLPFYIKNDLAEHNKGVPLLEHERDADYLSL
jgi:DNA repair photolyase